MYNKPAQETTKQPGSDPLASSPLLHRGHGAVGSVGEDEHVRPAGTHEDRQPAMPAGSKSLLITRTAVFFLSVFFQGMHFALPGPCLLDLQYQTGSTTQTITTIFTWRFAGSLLGTFFVGPAIDRLERHLVVATAFFTMAVTIAVAPWWKNLLGLSMSFFIGGFSNSFIAVGSVASILTLWGSKAAPFQQALQVVNTAGSILSPQIANPFLSSTATNITQYQQTEPETLYTATVWDNITVYAVHPPDFSMDGNCTDCVMFGNGSMTLNDDDVIQIKFAFLIVALLLIVAAFAHFLLFCISGCTFTSHIERPGDKGGHEKEINLKFKCLHLALFCLFAFVCGSQEEIYGGLLLAFVVKHLRSSKSEGSDIITVYWVSCFGSRVVAVVTSKFVRPQRMMVVNVTLYLIGSLVVTVAVNQHVSVMWMCTCVVGLGFGSMFPTLINWANSAMCLSGRETAAIFIGLYVGKMATPAVVGYLLQHHDSMWFLYVALAFALAALLLYGTLHSLQVCPIRRVTRRVARVV